MDEEEKRLVLIDGNAILHRAYHALPPLTNRSGELVNAVYGFATMLLRILAELHPEYIAVSFDTAKANFRHMEFVGYKANRPRMDSELVSQIQRVHDLVSAFNIPILEVDGYEADDVIGTIARRVTDLNSESRIINKGKKENKDRDSEFKTHDSNIEVLIVSGDKDLMQLVNGKVKLYMPTRGLSEGQVVGEKEVEEKMGLAPEKIADFKGLVGDQSDNYPGVPGIGPKTAIDLLEKFGSVEEIYQKLNAKKGFEGVGKNTIKKLADGAESAILSKKLATIITDVPISFDLEKCVAKDYDKEKVVAFFKELGFRSLVNRITGENKEEKEREVKKAEDKRQQSLF